MVDLGVKISRALLVALCGLSPSVLAQSSSTSNTAPSATERYADHGQQALAQGNYEEAEKDFEKLRELQPAMAEVHANLGLIYFQERKFEQAVPALRQALKLKPGLPKTGTLLAMSLAELGRYSEALPGLERGFRQSADPAAKRMCGLQLERAYTGLQRDSKAVEVALELDRLYPKDPEVLYHNSKVFGSFAFLTMQKLAAAAPGSIWRHQAAAEAYESQGSNELAIVEYRQVLSVDANRPGIHYRLGRTLLARSRQNHTPEDGLEAAKEFELELQLDPSNANAAYELGEIDRSAGKFEDAQKFFEQSLHYYADFEDANLGLAAVLISLGKPADALPPIQKAIQVNPESEIAFYRLSQAQGTLGNTSEQEAALVKFRQLRSEKSNHQEAETRIFAPGEVTPQELEPAAK